MASYRRGSRRRYDPYADERRAEEERREQQKRRTRARLDRLLRQFRRVRLSGEAADRAWKEPQLRSFTIGESGGVPVQTIVRGSRGQLFLQEPGFAGWSFFRLVPRYHTPREGEVSERDRRRIKRGTNMKKSRDGGGIYADLTATGLEKGDFVIYEDHRGRFRVDLITSSRGNHLTLGKVTGEPTVQAAVRLAEKESQRRGLFHSVIVAERGSGYTQIGNIVDGRYRKSG